MAEAEGARECFNCGASLGTETAYCPDCGTETGCADASRKHPALAVVLTLLVMGAGQLYAGNAARGVSWFSVGVSLAVYLQYSPPAVVILFPIPFACAVDAYVQTKRRNRRVAAGQ